MELKIVKSWSEVTEFVVEYKKSEIENIDKPYKITFEGLNFDFDINLSECPFLKIIERRQNTLVFTPLNVFSQIECLFNWCTFKKIDSHKEYKERLEFNECTLDEIDFRDSRFTNKIRFYECNFYKSNFVNTGFVDLADFWSSTFENPISFYKTNFEGTTVFAACHFKENVLFTYSLFKDKIIFRGTDFEKGLDLSLALNSGEYSFFNMSLSNYESVIHTNEESYNKLIGKCIIPMINKKETFRIIKQYFKDNGDDLDYVKFSMLEKKPIYSIVLYNLVNTKIERFWDYIHYSFELISLFLNRISNNNRNSYILGIIFTVSVGFLFFSFSLLTLPEFHLNFCNCELHIWDNSVWKLFLSFLNPTHDVKLFDSFNPNGWTYLWQTLGRIFLGYGIYQTIQAFRKLK